MLNDSLNLYYTSPAKAWVEALPLGNGALGAMVFGKTDREKIQMNSDTFWTGYPRKARMEPDCYESFLKARELSLEGKNGEAQEIIEKKCLGNWTQSYLPLCDIIIKFNKSGIQKNYRRVLDLENALFKSAYTRGSVNYRTEAFVSHPADVFVSKYVADKKGALSFTVKMTSKVKHEAFTENGVLIIDGVAPSDSTPNQQSFKAERGAYYSKVPEKQGIHARGALSVMTDGKTEYKEDCITVSGATEAVIYFVTENSFNGYDKLPATEGKEYKEACLKKLKAVIKRDFNELKGEHIKDYSELFSRVKLDLGSSEKADVPTDKRLKLCNKGAYDPALYTLMFNFGRYLIIAASREGTQPSNLQGIWNDKLSPPWNSNYTVNINTEMNYWPVLMCDLPECNLPLIEMIKDLSKVGIEVAKDRYHASGFCVNHNVDLWRYASPVSGNAQWAFWPLSGGWFCEHIYNHYLYTGDSEYLRETAYPIMRESARFFLDMLVSDKDGFLIFAPSTSPENSFNYHGKNVAVSQTTTMTMSIIKELFTNLISAAEKLGISDETVNEAKEKLPKLLPFKTGSEGQLLEWYDDEKETELHHRHKSHLYGLHPANLITPDETPELANACRRSLERRGDNGTGWSLGWKINMWARLWDGDHALKLLKMQLNPVSPSKMQYHGGGTYPNLFDAHPPFQIDGNYGYVSGVCEMLLQSREGKIFLLPALPSEWKNGNVSGLKAIGNIGVDISWENGELKDYTLRGNTDGVEVYVKGKRIK